MKSSGQMNSRNAVACRTKIFSYGVHMDKTKSLPKIETLGLCATGQKLSFCSHFLTDTDILAKFSPVYLLQLRIFL